jgi:peroxiredoxin/tetratricopeptide (TPR) repeat protein
MTPPSWFGVFAVSLVVSAAAPAAPPKTIEVPAGHSHLGDVFNEGPRQKAYLMGGTGNVDFPISTKNTEAQAFFNQGVGQFHGFWFFEAERSFRQAAALDPACAMNYWGMAVANFQNRKRGKGFIDKAVAHKTGARGREILWIEAYARYFTDGKDEKQRRRDLVKSLEDISYEFPHDLEAKAFLAFHIWDNNYRGWSIPSSQSFDALVGEILAAEPMHPAHHYRIHLWDAEKPARALKSAALCGQSSPNIAHMWHMPGHTFAHLHRYAEAAWQQEAAARVDHRHMMHDRVLPDQIHNYAHNNQWLVEDLGYVGRVRDAIDLAKNMIELPRHPRHNSFGLKDDGSPYANHGSSSEGRRRLFEVLTTYELWDETIALSDTIYLEPTDITAEQIKRLRTLGVAYFGRGDKDAGNKQIAALEAMRKAILDERRIDADKAEAKAREAKQSEAQIAKAITDALMKGAAKLPPIEAALKELQAYAHLTQGDKEKARKQFGEVNDAPPDRMARVWLQLGDKEKAVKLAKELADRSENQVQRLANYIDILHRAGKTDEAKQQFKRLRELSAYIDLNVAVMQRLAPVARSLNLASDWRVPPSVPPDAGQRPILDDLGPFRWQPSPAADWSLADAQGRTMSLKDYRGKPVVVIFYLGRGCPHCIEQLEAFEPVASQYAAAGISLVGISTDSAQGLQQTLQKTKAPFSFPLLSDPDLKVFKGYRAYDDFEHMPLHGTFLIDGDGLVRWQDVSFEPFRETKFLLAEAKRLLNMPKARMAARAAKAGGN